MADSEEELDRRRNREKFRRERSDHDGKRRPGDKREPFDDRVTLPTSNNCPGFVGTNTNSYSRGERRPYNSNIATRERLSPTGREPPYKKPRRDWNDDFTNRNSYRRRDNRQGGVNITDGGTCTEFDQACFRAPLMPFKRFLDPLDDFVTMEDACEKYRTYKTALTKKQIDDFFEAHKSEEW
ncbi:unnamed protein product [Protopolystoma xenopodis]|uniref:SERRATE/Ars2 N-terminal domain-containing protein n=1 Tax=Protopolystoma xenopodis TaxID=117903 RepID=A0A448X8F2_9PLAT|nr:unnamed protein product [Protopolystoma xenopodis]